MANDFRSDIGQFLGGIFGNSNAPYEDAMKEYEKYGAKAEGVQNPFLQFGQAGMPMFQKWLSTMSDPTSFINSIMKNYQESPYAKFQQEQGLRAAQNMGSASGLTGSTPLTQFAEEQAQGISSADMQNWLKNVLGINTEYGAGLGQQIGVGQNAANSLTSLYNNMGQEMAEGAYGSAAGKNQDRNNMWGGLFNLAGDVGNLF